MPEMSHDQLNRATSWRGLVDAVRHPIPLEGRMRTQQRGNELPPELKTPQQLIGVAHHSCGATHGVMERCDLACTSCYLSAGANAMPPMEEAEVREQLDQLRAYLGPQGKAQLTSGEVTLLPRRVLGSYVRYARQIGLDPMVMTHGRRLLKEPHYLQELVALDGLEKISIHVDSTQRGRQEWHPGCTEKDMEPLRERYAHLIRKTRLNTGRPLHAAHTVTVNQDNLKQVGQITRWVVNNADAFRMVSFQPVAAVGRTQDDSNEEITIDRVWREIESGIGAKVNREAMHFGHPACNVVVPLVVVSNGKSTLLLETNRFDRAWDSRWMRHFFERAGGYSVRGRSTVENLAAFTALVARYPIFAAETLAYGASRIAEDSPRLLRMLMGAIGSGQLRVHPLVVIIHKFMSPHELDTPLGEQRLAACTFKVPVGQKMISMCELNATELRSKLYDIGLSRGKNGPTQAQRLNHRGLSTETETQWSVGRESTGQAHPRSDS